MPSGPNTAANIPRTMRAWVVERPGPIGSHPLTLVDLPVPIPGPGELLVRVLACGVCRTDLHVAEGDLPVHRALVVPGHEIVGEVVGTGPEPSARGTTTVHGTTDDPTDEQPAPFAPGDRVGVAWLCHTDGTCRYCRRGDENLCPASRYTGWDADGGYAEYTTVPADFAYRLPDGYDDVTLAPLLCAGIIGYRALRRAAVPAGGRLGLYGFGGSAHLTAQVAISQGAAVHVFTRGASARELALRLGATSAQGVTDPPPEPLDSAILFAPVGDLVPVAMRALDRGGVLAVAGIHLSDVPALTYETDLFYEKELRSVTSNTRDDGRDLLAFAAEHHLDVDTHRYPLDRADEALADLKAGRFAGAAVLVP